MKIVDGKDAILGRLASFVAKQALKGEEMNIVNCEDVKISGSKIDIQADFKEKRDRSGHSKRDPKYPRVSEKMVKKTIRGMLPDFRLGRGKEALKRIKCYNKVPKEFEASEKINMADNKLIKFSRVKEFAK
jgi:large subunit ribosomal protein L13